MNREKPNPHAERLIQAWIEERQDDEAASPGGQGPDERLVSLLLASGRATPPAMSEEEAERVLIAVRSGIRARPRLPLRLRAAAASMGWRAAALLALALGLGLWVRGHSPGRSASEPDTTAAVVVKEVRFETVQEGKVVRFHMTVYRTEKAKEVPRAQAPSL